MSTAHGIHEATVGDNCLLYSLEAFDQGGQVCLVMTEPEVNSHDGTIEMPPMSQQDIVKASVKLLCVAISRSSGADESAELKKLFVQELKNSGC